MLDDQAAALRNQAQNTGQKFVAAATRCVAVGSGKGGVGKTMISVSLSYALARRGRRTLLVDADLGLANVDLQVGAEPHFTLQDVIFGKCPLHKAILRLDKGPDILAAASGSPELADMGGARRQMFVEELMRFSAQYDFLVIDVAAGIGHNVTSFLSAAPETLVVVANEPTSIMDAYALIKTLSRDPAPPALSIVVNMVNSFDEGRRLAERLNDIVRRFLGKNLPVAGIVPYDRAVGNAIRARRSIMTLDPLPAPARVIEDIAAGIIAARRPQQQERRAEDNIFNRLLGASPVELRAGGAS